MTTGLAADVGTGARLPADLLPQPLAGARVGASPTPDDHSVEEARLVRSAMGGNAEATRELLRRLVPEVRRVVCGVLGVDHPELEDTIQEALIALVKALPDFRFESPVEHYAVRIAFRAANRTKKRVRTLRERYCPSDGEEAASSSASTPSDNLLAAEQRRALDRVLSKLPRAQSEILLLWVVLGFSAGEISRICGVPVNTVKSRLQRGRETLHYYVQRDEALTSRSFGAEERA